MNISASLGPGQWLTVPLVCRRSDGTVVDPNSISGTTTISDYTKAYGAMTSVCYVVPRTQPAEGESFVVSLVVNPKDKASGVALDPIQIDVTFNGPPHPAQVVQSVEFGTVSPQSPIDTLHGTPGDPGSDTVTFG